MSRLVSALVLIASIGLAAGCGSQGRPTAEISGRVTYHGKPLKGGNVVFYTNDNGLVSTTIAGDGMYLVTLPVEQQVRVTIETESVNPDRAGAAQAYGKGQGQGPARATGGENKMKAERMKVEGKGGNSWSPGSFGPPPREVLAERYTKIPAKYAAAGTSPIVVDLEPGRQTKDIELKD